MHHMIIHQSEPKWLPTLVPIICFKNPFRLVERKSFDSGVYCYIFHLKKIKVVGKNYSSELYKTFTRKCIKYLFNAYFLLGMFNHLKLPSDLLLWFDFLSSYSAVLVETSRARALRGLTRMCVWGLHAHVYCILYANPLPASCLSAGTLPGKRLGWCM